MFLRSVKARNGRHQYLRLVESVREGHKVKQRVVPISDAKISWLPTWTH